MFCVNLESSNQKVVDRFEKAAGREVSAHAVVLRFQKFMLRLTIKLLIFVMSLLRWNRLDIEAFAFTTEVFTFTNTDLNEALSVVSEPSVFETLHNDELMTAIKLKIFVSFAIKVLHRFETFIQQAFE